MVGFIPHLQTQNKGWNHTIRVIILKKYHIIANIIDGNY